MLTKPSVIRLWDSEWNLIWSSTEDSRTLEDVLLDMYAQPYHVTKDFAYGYRWSGTVQREVFGLHWVPDVDYLKYIVTWANPFMAIDAQEEFNRKVDEILAPLYDDVWLSYLAWLKR